MRRNNTKKKRGGDNQEISDFKIKLDKVQADLDRLKDTLSTLDSSSAINISDSKISDSSSSDSILEGLSSSLTSSIPSLESSSSSSDILQQNISLDGYSGTVKDIIDKIRKKNSDLGKLSNKGRYQDKIDENKSVISAIQKASSIDEVKSAIQNKLMFKNNNLMGGKTKKRGKRRRSKSMKK
jgi:hypothetical protein